MVSALSTISSQNASDYLCKSVQPLAWEEAGSPIKISGKEQDRKEAIPGFFNH